MLLIQNDRINCKCHTELQFKAHFYVLAIAFLISDQTEFIDRKILMILTEHTFN